MDIVNSTARYEAWLGGFMPLLAEDLQAKHDTMRDDAFGFFRATFYRWAEVWPRLPRRIAHAPEVLGVGDVHVENFGTWRDRDGRLVWGLNDFDEAAPLPYTNDLVRLAVSGLLARQQGLVRIHAADMLQAMMLGYTEGLRRGGGPFVIEENNTWLRDLAQSGARAPLRYWRKLLKIAAWDRAVPKRARRLLNDVPNDATPIRIVHRISGAGSLGRPRLAALYEWRGGYLAREVKARAPSAWTFAIDPGNATRIAPLSRILKRAVRCPDPYLDATRHWSFRRLSPDCSRIELADLPKKRQEIALFRAMGWEVANVHLGSMTGATVGRHQGTLSAHWLREACDAMLAAVEADHREWQRRAPASPA